MTETSLPHSHLQVVIHHPKDPEYQLKEMNHAIDKKIDALIHHYSAIKDIEITISHENCTAKIAVLANGPKLKLHAEGKGEDKNYFAALKNAFLKLNEQIAHSN